MDPNGYGRISNPMWKTEQAFRPLIKERNSKGVPGPTVGNDPTQGSFDGITDFYFGAGSFCKIDGAGTFRKINQQGRD